MLALTLALMAPVVRDLRPGTERRYRVEVVREAGDRYAYRLRTKVVRPKAPKGAKVETRLDLRLTDYRATSGDQKLSAGTIGGGEMGLEPTGLPGGLEIAGPQGPLWLPLLAFYLPTLDEDGEIAIPKIGVGALAWSGTGTWKRPRFDLDTALSRGDQELGKLTLATTLDKAGWPQKAEGTLVSADGTYRFTVERA